MPFSTENEERTAQDVGFDGLDDSTEATKFGTNFINPVTNTQILLLIILFSICLINFKGL